MHTTFLKSLATASGPLATVCLDVTHVSEDAARQLELKARAVSEQLTAQGAPETVARTIADTLLTGNDDPDAGQWRGRAVVADEAGNLLLDQGLMDAPVREVVEWATVPDLLPVLRQLPARLPHVIAVVDRVGADVEVIGESGTVTEQS